MSIFGLAGEEAELDNLFTGDEKRTHVDCSDLILVKYCIKNVKEFAGYGWFCL